MATGSEFSKACKEASRGMRRLPKELRRTLANRVRDEVAEPLAADIRAAWSGGYAPKLATATKARVQADPQIIVGGSRKVFSGGASVRDVVFGAEWGGGKRVAVIPRRDGRRGHTRRSTRQFAATGQHAVYGTIGRTLEQTFDRWASVVDDVIDQELPGG